MSQTLTYVMGADRRVHVKNIQDFKIDFSDDNHNWVQARQFERGMRQVFVNIVNEDGTPFDLTGCNVWFEGLLPKTADGDFRVIDDDGYVPLDPSAGKFRFDMPGHAFTVAGSYRQAFFRILKNNNSVTTLEFDLDVLADKVIDGLVPKDWVGPFNKIADQLVDSLQKHTDDADKILADFQKKVGDLIAQLNQQGSTTTSMLTELQNRITDLKEKIEQDNIVTKPQLDAFKQAIQKSIADQQTKLNSLENKVNLNELLLSGYNVKNFGAVGDGETDDTEAIQKAIKQVALDWKKDNFKTNLVVMPAGRYKVTSTIVLPPYVKLVSAGLVTIESYLTTGATIRIKWLGEDDPDITGAGLGNAYQNQDWQRGYIIEGTNGGFSFVSKVKNDANIGIELGFESFEERGASNLKNIARSGLNNIAIGNYGVGLRLNALDLFIFNFANVHMEWNKINVQNMTVTKGNNYGESIYFDRCIIAKADIGIDQASGGYDMVFNECSLDFNKVLFTSSDWADNSITIFGGNLEGNELIYDGSNDPEKWMTSVNIISANIYIRKDKTDSLLMFKGPLILNLDNPYIISDLDLTRPEYMCDDKVFVTYNRNPSFSRTSARPIFITERDNAILNGNDMSKVHMDMERARGTLVTVGNGLAKELQDAGYTSAYSYTRSADDSKNWDNFRPSQKIDVKNCSTFFLILFGVAHGVKANIVFHISYYDVDNKLITTDQFYATIPGDLNKVVYGATPSQHIPVNAVSAALAVGVSCDDVGSSFQFGYLGMEVE